MAIATRDEFDALYAELFDEQPLPDPPGPKRSWDATTTAICANCNGTLRMSMSGLIHQPGNGTGYCYPKDPNPARREIQAVPRPLEEA